VYSNEDYLLELLLEAGVTAQENIDYARQNVTGMESVVEKLVTDRMVSEEQVAQVCAMNSGSDFLDLNTLAIAPEVFQAVPEEVARRFRAIPVADDGSYLTLAVADPLDFEVLDSLPHVLGRQVVIHCATGSAISRVIEDNYGQSDVALADYSISFGGGDEDDGDAPIIRLVYGVLTDAVKLGVSDIHIEPLETSLRIRYRIDGKLVIGANHPKKLLPAIIARLKVMSGSMSIAEKRLPQDGRIQIKMGAKEVDLRVSSVPSNHGESIVMRILDKSSLSLGLPELGFLSDDEEQFSNFLGLPDGIILVTGPTGSGKTTTLYASLNTINRPDRKIITVEDPVEYQLGGINQVMVKSDIGMTFSAALRAMLRQAPNIIMIGEIRDAETANIAINASLTGHLVFSTLHTNDAPSAVARLADIGVKPFLIASAMRAVLAQRLIRKLCKCKIPVELSEKEMRSLKLDSTRAMGGNIFGPGGCEICRDGGYKGRAGIFEIFDVDDEIRHSINQGFTSPQLRKRARELGMRTMREDGIRKVLSGVTSASEVIGVTMGDED